MSVFLARLIWGGMAYGATYLAGAPSWASWSTAIIVSLAAQVDR